MWVNLYSKAVHEQSEITIIIDLKQGIGIKVKEMALVWHKKASRTALQTISVNLTYTLLEQIHIMTTVKEIAEQCRQLYLSFNDESFIVNFDHVIFFA